MKLKLVILANDANMTTSLWNINLNWQDEVNKN